jgi:hypothetical protein
MSNYYLSEMLVRVHLAERYDEAGYRRAVGRRGRSRPWHPDRAARLPDDVTRFPS